MSIVVVHATVIRARDMKPGHFWVLHEGKWRMPKPPRLHGAAYMAATARTADDRTHRVGMCSTN